MSVRQPVRPIKILVVDDEASLVQVCQLILQEAGHKVRGALNGRQALRMVTEDMPDLILLDVMMPGMSGIEVCHHIRHNYQKPRPRILMYTADDREEVRARSLAAGADALIAKQNPFLDLTEKITPYLTADRRPA